MNAADIAELQAKRDAENAPPPGVSRKAWGALKNGWVPNPGTPMYEVYLRHVCGIDPDAPPTRGETVRIGIWLATLLAIGGLLSYCMAHIPEPEFKYPNQCIPKIPKSAQANCVDWTKPNAGRTNNPVPIDKDAPSEHRHDASTLDRM